METSPQIPASQMEVLEELDQAWVLSCLPRDWSEAKRNEVFQIMQSRHSPVEFREDMAALDMAAFRALGSLRKRDPTQLLPLPAEAKANIAMWVGQADVPQEVEERLVEFLSQISKEEAELIAKHPVERTTFIQQNMMELVKQLDAELVVKLGEHRWPHEQTKGWVIRHLRGRFPDLAMRNQSELSKAIFLGLQAFRFKNPNATEDLLQRVELTDIAPCIPWIVEAPTGLQPNIRKMLTWVSKAEMEMIKASEEIRQLAVDEWIKEAKEHNFNEFQGQKNAANDEEGFPRMKQAAGAGGTKVAAREQRKEEEEMAPIPMNREVLGEGLERFVAETPEETRALWITGLAPNDEFQFLKKTTEGVLEDLGIFHLVDPVDTALLLNVDQYLIKKFLNYKFCNGILIQLSQMRVSAISILKFR